MMLRMLLALAAAPAATVGPLPTGADRFVDLVVRHCLSEKLADGGQAGAAIDGAVPSSADRKQKWMKLSDQARVVPTSDGRVLIDQDENYCRVIAHQVRGRDIERRLAAALNSGPFVSTFDVNQSWRDGLHKVRDVEFHVTSHASAKRTPIVLLYYTSGSGSWVDAEVGFSYPEPDPDFLKHAVP
jgi:hypothetical protein